MVETGAGVEIYYIANGCSVVIAANTISGDTFVVDAG